MALQDNPAYKYDEDKLLAEIKAYVDGTYGAHYVGSDNIQAIDLMAAGGMLLHFAASSIIKYAFRFGKKDGFNRKDVLKIIHYAMFILWQMNKTSGSRKLTEEEVKEFMIGDVTLAAPPAPSGGLKPPYGWQPTVTPNWGSVSTTRAK